MRRIIAPIVAVVIAAVLIVVGAIALIGAVEITQSGPGAETVAQAFLVPVSLFAVGGFLLWVGIGRRE